MDTSVKEKISMFCHVEPEQVKKGCCLLCLLQVAINIVAVCQMLSEVLPEHRAVVLALSVIAA